jgi:hypothetical protein
VRGVELTEGESGGVVSKKCVRSCRKSQERRRGRRRYRSADSISRHWRARLTTSAVPSLPRKGPLILILPHSLLLVLIVEGLVPAIELKFLVNGACEMGESFEVFSGYFEGSPALKTPSIGRLALKDQDEWLGLGPYAPNTSPNR